MVRIDQALFGYERGHKLLASSVGLNAEAARTLRNATDMSFGGKSDQLFTALPLPSMKAHAFVMSWPAEAWVRAGSVWSHVLLVDHVSLGEIRGLAAALNLFSRPSFVDGDLDPSRLTAYRSPLELVDNGRTPHLEIDPAVHRDMIGALYGRSGPVTVTKPNLNDLPLSFLAIMEQQWPRLRRTMFVRSRIRGSESEMPIDLEVVERGASATRTEAWPTWADSLVKDSMRPDPKLEWFLRRYGAEALNGRSDMAALIEVHQLTDHGIIDSQQLAERVALFYGDPSEMRTLKRELFGARRSKHGGNWSLDESQKLNAVFSIAHSVDFEDLRVSDTLAALISRTAPGGVLPALDFSRLSIRTLDDLLAGLFAQVDMQLLNENLLRMPDLAILATAQRPELLGNARFWEVLDRDLLLEIADGLPEADILPVIDALIGEGAVEALVRLTSIRPGLWWSAVVRNARNAESFAVLAQRLVVLRRVVERVGAASVGAPVEQVSSLVELVAVLMSSDLSSGLWRKVPPETWSRGAKRYLRHGSGDVAIPRDLVEKLFVVALLSALNRTGAQVRESGWMTTFGFLHDALKSPNFDPESWRQLSPSLPKGPDWDRCLRLRAGAVGEIRRHHWSRASSLSLCAQAGEFGPSMVKQVEPSKKKAEKISWIEEFVRLLRS